MDNEQVKELRSAVNAYIRSKGAEVRAVDGFKLIDGGALVPEELLTPEKAVEDRVDLLQYVKIWNKNEYSCRIGKKPGISKTNNYRSHIQHRNLSRIHPCITGGY
ncbi:hypothetical protein D3C76_1500830 [compost metagenome]